MIDRGDVLIEPCRPGVAERLGIGPDVCLGRNPRLIYARMTGWGQEGPWAGMAGHDIAYIAVTGALHAIGRSGRPPQPRSTCSATSAAARCSCSPGCWRHCGSASDLAVGRSSTQPLWTARRRSRRTSSGYAHKGGWSDERGTNQLDTGAPCYDVHETADGEWMAVGAIEPQFFAQLAGLLQLDRVPTQNEVARWPELRKLLADRFRQRTRDEWAAVFADTDACVAPVLTFAEAQHHPQISALQTLVRRDGVPQPAPAPRFSRTPAQLAAPPVAAGAHTREVLGDWGISNVAELLASGAAVQSAATETAR